LGAVSFRAGTSVRLSRRQGVVGRARGGAVAAVVLASARAAAAPPGIIASRQR